MTKRFFEVWAQISMALLFVLMVILGLFVFSR